MRKNRWSVLSAFLVACLSSANVRAQSGAVEAHLQRGVELRRAGRDEEAAREFAAAYRIAATPRTAAQWGLALQASGQWVEAEGRIREALRAQGDPWVQRNRAALQQALSVAEEHLGFIDVVSSVAGAEVLLDGRSVGTTPLSEPARVLPGEIRIEVRTPGRETTARSVRVRGGEHLRERFDPRVASATIVSSTGENTGSTSSTSVVVGERWEGGGLRYAGIGVLAAGAVAGGAAIATYAGAQGEASAYNSAMSGCPNATLSGVMPTGMCAERLNSGRTLQSASIGLVIGGGILTVTGAVLIGIGGPRRVSSATSAMRVCTPLLDGAGIVCGGRF